MTRRDPLHLPPLLTLNSKPSWVNRAGRVDRSACVEVRASELRRTCGNMKSARTSTGRLAAGTITMHAIWLAAMHGGRKPFALQGDFRTAKSNAMKNPRADENAPVSEQRWPFNPNRSAARTKLISLWTGGEPGHEASGRWTQEIRIERWERKAKKRAPTCRRGEDEDDARRQTAGKPARETKAASPPSHQHFLICPRCEKKFIKLFMVLCTREEAFDSELAEGWIARMEAKHRGSNTHLSREFYEMRAKLINRYGLLFRARRLACRTCLGIRYGQVRNKERRIDPYDRIKSNANVNAIGRTTAIDRVDALASLDAQAACCRRAAEAVSVQAS